ncbi:MAG: cytochrome-c peroxidase [Saprospiraceae bacterium]
MLLPADNPLTEEGIALGRQLFYDPLLSMNGSVSCATCHLPQNAFSDGLAFSVGVNGQKGPRSSMPLANVGYYYKGLFWDGRSKSLEDQALVPVREPHEMNSDWSLVELKLRNHPKYPELFQKAFSIRDRKEITRFLVAKAIAQFERTLISANAKYDQVLEGKATYTESEERGRKIFFDASDELPKSECGHCHIDPLFTNLDFLNNGIQQVNSLEDFPDKGRGKVTKIIYDNGKFRVPTLRNIELTAPYMHDGRFNSLEEVLDHYISGGHLADNLNPNVRELNFSERDKSDLIAFLKTLTDTSFINNPAFANPFSE